VLGKQVRNNIFIKGAIVFATKYTQSIERNAKFWRVVSIALASFSLLMETTTLIYPKYFLLIATFANIFKLISLSGNGISRVTILEHLSKQHNIVDVTNKSGLQQNIALLTGNLIGFGISLMIPINNFAFTFTALAILSVFNIYCGVKSIRFIKFDDFNFQRMCVMCEEYIENKNVLSPKEISDKERFVFKKYSNVHFCTKSPEVIMKHENSCYLLTLFDLFKDKNYFVLVGKDFNLKKRRYEHVIYTFLRVNAENMDILQSFIFTIKLHKLIHESPGIKSYDKITEMIEKSMSYMEELDRKVLLEKMKLLGWSHNFAHLEETYARLHMLFKTS
jgi:hypothetical protein